MQPSQQVWDMPRGVELLRRPLPAAEPSENMLLMTSRRTRPAAPSGTAYLWSFAASAAEATDHSGTARGPSAAPPRDSCSRVRLDCTRSTGLAWPLPRQFIDAGGDYQSSESAPLKTSTALLEDEVSSVQEARMLASGSRSAGAKIVPRFANAIAHGVRLRAAVFNALADSRALSRLLLAASRRASAASRRSLMASILRCFASASSCACVVGGFHLLLIPAWYWLIRVTLPHLVGQRNRLLPGDLRIRHGNRRGAAGLRSRDATSHRRAASAATASLRRASI